MEEKQHQCIFCLEKSTNFNTAEHIVPESLGNTDDILYNAVCDKCQKYFGKEIENFVLSKTPFGFWRTLAGTKNKKGKLPYFDATQDNIKVGKIDNFHPYNDNGIIISPVDNESIVEVIIKDGVKSGQILSGQKNKINLVLTPKILIYMGRFLGKIALEYWCKEFGDNILDVQFDELRKYVRYGTTNSMWPILRADLNENLLKFKATNEFEEEHILYAYSFYKTQKVILFCFDIGTERYSLIINNKDPDGNVFTEELLSVICKGTNRLPDILHYNL